MKSNNYSHYRSRLAIAMASTTLCGVAALPTISVAQESTSNTRRALTLEEITVTANRVESLASDTPIALSVVSGDVIAEQGLSDPSKLGDFTPNLGMGTWAGGIQITMRGITNSDITERGDPAAGFLIDDVYIARPNGVDISLFDINRIEALRGPQGTLFGRNTTAGAINVLTNRPVFEAEGSATLGIGDYGSRQGTLVYNLPVNDSFAVRAGVNYDRRDNYLDEGPAVTSDLSPFKDSIAMRLQGLKTWGSGEFLLRGEYADIGGNYLEYVPSNHFYAQYPASGTDAKYTGGSTDDILKVNFPATWDIERENKAWSLTGELKQALGEWDLTYIGSFRKLERDEDEPRPDDDGDRLFRIGWKADIEQYSHEVRLATTQGPLQFQVGAYYLYEEISQDIKLVLASGTDGNDPAGLTIWWHTDPLENKSWAFFGQGTYELNNELRLTLGARYSDDTKTRDAAFQVFCSEYDCLNETTPRSIYSADGNWNKTTWRLGLDYDLTDSTMVYASVSTGYKAGGFIDGCEVGTQPNCGFDADALYYDPEEIINYEVGAKGLLWDDTFNFNLAVFHYKYDDMQQSAIQNNCLGPGTTSCTITTNAATAGATGIELESTLLLTESDRLEINTTWIQAEFDDYAAPARDFSGETLNYSPEWTATLGYMHIFDLDGGAVVEASIRSKYSDSYAFVDAGGGSLFPQPSYTRTNVSLTYRSPDNAWYLQGYVNNLEDEVPVTNVIFGPTRRGASFQPPRTYGMRAGLKF